MMRSALTIALLSALAACSGDAAEFGEPRTVGKDKRSIVWNAGTAERLGVGEMGPASGGSTQASDGARRVVADVPAGWQERASTSQFIDAAWSIDGQPDCKCHLAIGVGGGVAMNLSRWYTMQFGIAEVPGIDALPQVQLGNKVGRLCEIEGTFSGRDNWSALIAFYAEGERVTSLKLTGPAAVVKGNRQQFLDLARSIRFASASPDPKAPPIRKGQPLPEGHAPVGDGLPQGHPPTNQGHAPQASSPYSGTTPAGWTVKQGSRRFLHHTFGKGSEVYVSNIGGTLKQALDIWRGELGMAAMNQSEFEALPNTLFLGDDAVLMDLSGKFRGMSGVEIEDARMLIAARRDGATVTFSKLVGPKTEVDAERDAFVQFCGSVRRAQ